MSISGGICQFAHRFPQMSEGQSCLKICILLGAPIQMILLLLSVMRVLSALKSIQPSRSNSPISLQTKEHLSICLSLYRHIAGLMLLSFGKTCLRCCVWEEPGTSHAIPGGEEVSRVSATRTLKTIKTLIHSTLAHVWMKGSPH